MNILILNWRDPKNPKSGGAEVVTLEHAKAWIKAGHKVTWFTSSFSMSKKEELINGINVIRKGNFISVYLIAPLYYLNNRNNFDVVVDQIHGFPFFTPLYVRKPKIAFIHEVAGEIWDYMYPFPLNKICKGLEYFLFIPYKNINFMTVSESTKKELINVGINNKKIAIIKNGLSNKPLSRPSEKEKELTLIFISRIVKMKGIENVLNAFKIINLTIPQSKIWIIGSGDEKYVNRLKKKTIDENYSNYVEFLGKINDKEKLVRLKRAHILLHASVKEGWGLVVVEAASQATPSIAYNVAGLRDSVENGKTGILLSNNSPEEMANETIKLFNDSVKYKQLQLNCLKLAETLDWKKSTHESLSLLNSILD